jgi:hypothetical protein
LSALGVDACKMLLKKFSEDRVVFLIFSAFLLTQLFYPFFRWVFQVVKLGPLFYTPALLALLYSIYKESYAIYSSRWSPYRAAFDLVLVLSLLVGILHTKSLVAAGFGFWILNPFFFGLAAGRILLARFEFLKFSPLILLGVIFTGLILDDIAIDFPWRGLETEIAGTSVTVSKVWTSNGVRRLSGFQSSSIESSRWILFLLVFILVGSHKTIVKLIVTIFAFYFISLTTTKVTLLAAIPATIMLLLPERTLTYSAKTILSFFVVIGISLPAYSFVTQWPFDIRDVQTARALFSFEDRFSSMWPSNLEHLVEHGNILLGSGLGNFGASAIKFSSVFIPASDNIYLYVYQITGVVGLLFFFYVLLKFMVMSFSSGFTSRFVLAFLATILIAGVTDGTFESPISALLLGICISQIMGNKAKTSEIEPSGNLVIQR